MSNARWKVVCIGPASATRAAVRCTSTRPSGGEHAEDHAVGATFAGEAHLFEHLAEFGIGIEEIPAAGTHHHAELQPSDTARHTDGGSRGVVPPS